MIYRVKQIDDNTFIPQCRPWYSLEWDNIDRKDNFAWHTYSHYAHHSSLESAKTTIERYKTYLKKESRYPKYFKV